MAEMSGKELDKIIKCAEIAANYALTEKSPAVVGPVVAALVAAALRYTEVKKAVLDR